MRCVDSEWEMGDLTLDFTLDFTEANAKVIAMRNASFLQLDAAIACKHAGLRFYLSMKSPD